VWLDTVVKILLLGVYPIVVVLFFFGLTIFAHEWGHYLMARRRGMVVERFSFFGMGPPIVKWVRKGVEYCICWIPIGAYVQIPQMAPMEALEGESKKKAEELPPVTPESKILVALAGPVMNLVFATGLACILWALGSPSQSTYVGWVKPGSSEELAGIQPGDRVVRINDQRVHTWSELTEAVAFSRQSSVQVAVERGSERHSFEIEPKVNEKLNVKMLEVYPREKPYARGVVPGSPAEKAGLQPGDRFVSIEGVPLYSSERLMELVSQRTDQETTFQIRRNGELLSIQITPLFNKEFKKGKIGVELGDETETIRPGPNPLAQFGEILRSMGKMVMALVHHKETGVGVSSLAGPVGIGYMWWAAIVSGGLLLGVKIGVLLNLNLAILNLLPIPVLDGGHIVFGLWEKMVRRPLNAKFVARTQTAFAVLLLTLMLYITVFGDIRRFLPKRKAATEEQQPVKP